MTENETTIPDTTEADRAAEEARQQGIVDAVAEKNERLAAGEDPDQSGVSGPADAEPEAEPEPAPKASKSK